MGYRSQDYFKIKLKRFLQAVNSKQAFRIIIVTSYPELTKGFQNFPQVIKIVKFGDHQTLDKVLDALPGL